MTNKNKQIRLNGAVDVPTNTKQPLAAQCHVAFPLNLLEQILLTHLRDYQQGCHNNAAVRSNYVLHHVFTLNFLPMLVILKGFGS